MPVVKVHIVTPYSSGEVRALCLPNTIYDLIVGNVSNARAADDLDPDWYEVGVVVTRVQARAEGQSTPRSRYNKTRTG